VSKIRSDTNLHKSKVNHEEVNQDNHQLSKDHKITINFDQTKAHNQECGKKVQ